MTYNLHVVGKLIVTSELDGLQHGNVTVTVGGLSGYVRRSSDERRTYVLNNIIAMGRPGSIYPMISSAMTFRPTC